jgi:hypothetical protein
MSGDTHADEDAVPDADEGQGRVRPRHRRLQPADEDAKPVPVADQDADADEDTVSADQPGIAVRHRWRHCVPGHAHAHEDAVPDQPELRHRYVQPVPDADEDAVSDEPLVRHGHEPVPDAHQDAEAVRPRSLVVVLQVAVRLGLALLAIAST